MFFVLSLLGDWVRLGCQLGLRGSRWSPPPALRKFATRYAYSFSAVSKTTLAMHKNDIKTTRIPTTRNENAYVPLGNGRYVFRSHTAQNHKILANVQLENDAELTNLTQTTCSI